MTEKQARAEIETINGLLSGDESDELMAIEWRERKKELEEYLDKLGGAEA